MKYLKKFENYADEVTNEVGGPEKPIQRPDLKGKPYDAGQKHVPNLPVVYAVEFVPSGTFGAVRNAEDYLKDMGYNIGSMEMNNPIGFSDEYEYISKWWNMTPSEHKLLDGVMVSDDFREGGVTVLFFNPPNL